MPRSKTSGSKSVFWNDSFVVSIAEKRQLHLKDIFDNIKNCMLHMSLDGKQQTILKLIFISYYKY